MLKTVVWDNLGLTIFPLLGELKECRRVRTKAAVQQAVAAQNGSSVQNHRLVVRTVRTPSPSPIRKIVAYMSVVHLLIARAALNRTYYCRKEGSISSDLFFRQHVDCLILYAGPLCNLFGTHCRSFNFVTCRLCVLLRKHHNRDVQDLHTELYMD